MEKQEVGHQHQPDAMLAQILEKLTELQISVNKVDNERKRNEEEVRELRAQISSQIQTSDIAQPVAANSGDAADNLNLPSTTASTSNQQNSQIFNIAPAQRPQSIPQAEEGYLVAPNSTYVDEVGKKMYPLPIFTGKPEEWPLFSVSFNDTTQEFGYTHRQNLMRLQKALQGDAKEAVASLLIYPNNVPQIIEELRFNFGRPDILVRSQIQQLQQIPAITENNSEGIIHLANKVRNIVAFFKSANCSEQLMNPMLLEQLLLKLPRSKQFEWAKYASNIKSYVTIEDFSKWISDMAKILCFMPTPINSRQNSASSNTSQSSVQPKKVLQTSFTKKIVCTCCKKEHSIVECERFKSFNINEKWEHVKQNRLCISCLKTGHQLKNCLNKKLCNITGCKRMHHKLLHKSLTEEESDNSESHVQQVYNLCSTMDSGQLFRIIPVILRGPQGSISAFAMFDDGSSVTLVEEDVAHRLGLKGQSSTLSLQWYDDKIKTEISKKVSIEISGIEQQAEVFTLRNVRTVKKLSLPQQTLIKGKLKNLNSVPMSDYNNAVPVLLIGLDNCHLSIAYEIVDHGEGCPIAAKTKLGWVIYGPKNLTNSHVRICHAREIMPLKRMALLMESYCSIENEGIKGPTTPIESDECKRAKIILTQTTKKLNERYEIGLLWRRDDVKMPNNIEMAKNRLYKIEAKMYRNPAYAVKYNFEIQKYIDKGYARIVTDDELKQNSNTKLWYLPHFGVENINKPDKLRVVFDAAATVDGVSLNSHLMKGPEQSKPMLNIIMKFREGVIGVAGDIQEMFSQVKIIEEDQHSQRFLWRNGAKNEPIRHYVMTSMIFGATCSPCCAEYVKNINALHHMTTMPRGASAVINNMYVDDLVASFSSKKEACEVVEEAIIICAQAGFNLRGITSNAVQVERQFNPKSESTAKYIVTREFSHENESERVLGMVWNKSDDSFRFRFKFHKIHPHVLEGVRAPTKREMLGITMAIFDPLGFLANVTVLPKLLMQVTWKIALPWDAQLPPEIYKQWQTWWMKFRKVEDFRVPRCYTALLSQAEDIQLHIFVDASSIAYAAVAYLRVRKGQEVVTAFVAAKSRVAPTKPTTIPRLELQAALLGSRLKKSVLDGHNISINTTVFWSDSKTVILWIRSTKRQYKQFVGTRIGEILENSHSKEWRWLPTALNVADEATRKAEKINIADTPYNQWLNGPKFLKQSECYWPKEDNLMTTVATDEVHAELLLLKERQDYKVVEYERFSSFIKLQRCIAWVLRFVANMKKPKPHNGRSLSLEELETAKKLIYSWVQMESFGNDMRRLAKGENVKKNSDLYQLTPFLDDDGLIKVQGRISKARCLPTEFKRPIILPTNHHVTHLIMRAYHERLHHQNDDLTVNEMRQQFWVPRIRSLLKNVQRCCALCVKERAKPIMPRMGELPEDRLTPYLRPFSYVGVDYCGPFNVAIGRRREKKWVALFTCLNTRAIHLEIANDLSTDAFLICFRNFVNRRGTPVLIRSDNGTNFIKAKKLMTAESRIFDVNEIEKSMSKDNIEWILNCPGNPHAGGCWERLIKIVKRLLHRILKDEAPQFLTFNSVLIEAENIVNSRPLTDLPITADEEEPLTPNHFLLGCLNSTQTPAKETFPCMRKQWRIAQNLKDRLWKRWTLEYLPQLLLRPKWLYESVPLQEGQLVLIVDSILPRSQWKTGRIKKVFTAADGQVRAAEVQTSTGVLKRPAVKLAVLSFGESFLYPNDSRGVGCKN